MLTNIENRLEELFESIETMPPEKVEAAEKVGGEIRQMRENGTVSTIKQIKRVYTFGLLPNYKITDLSHEFLGPFFGT